MTFQADIAEVVQSFSPGDLVELFILDCSALGGPAYRFTPNTNDGAMVVFNSYSYTPVDMESEGWEMSGQGQAPTPVIRISNANSNRVLQAAVIEYGDLVGATLTRMRTFRQFLDGESEADPSAILSADIFLVERKSKMNKKFAEWELSSSLDQQGRKIPGRQIMRDACPFTYRYWDASSNAFDYSKATCPYNGSSYFDINGNVVTSPALDRAGKSLNLCCKKRFGENAELPYGGFPGVGRTQ